MRPRLGSAPSRSSKRGLVTGALAAKLGIPQGHGSSVGPRI